MGTLIPFIPVSCITFFIQISLSSIMVAVEVAPPSAVSSTSASNMKSRIHDEDVATDHLLEGKRYMLVKDYANAVESLALACEALSSQHGETASECADAYFHYGKALLELGRMESGVLGNALEGVPEEEASGEGSEKVESTEKMTEDEKEYVGVKVMEAIEENFEQHEEKIYLLAHGHTKGDLDEDDMEGDDSQDDGEGMEVEKEREEAVRHPPRPRGGQHGERELHTGCGGSQQLPREEEGQAARGEEADRRDHVPARGGPHLPRAVRRGRQVLQRLYRRHHQAHRDHEG